MTHTNKKEIDALTKALSKPTTKVSRTNWCNNCDNPKTTCKCNGRKVKVDRNNLPITYINF